MERSLPEIRELADHLIVVSDHAPVHSDAVNEWIMAYPRDEDAVLHAIRSAGIEQLDGVFSLGYENPRVIARVAAEFDCPTLPYDVAATCALKERRITTLAAAGVRVPRHRIISEHVQYDMDAVLEYVSLPCIVKPNDKTSSIGVSRVDARTEAKDAFTLALSSSASGTAIVEQYLSGTEHTVEGLAANDSVYVTGFSDRNYDQKHLYYPYVFEDGDTLPSRLPPDVVLQTNECVAAAVRALGLRNTAYHADVLISGGTIYVLEVTPRIAGSRFGTELVPLSTGVRVLPNAVRLSLGRPLVPTELAPVLERPRAVVTRFLPSPGGFVTAVGSLTELMAGFPCLYDCQWEMPLRPGQTVPQYHDGKDMLASVIAVADSISDAQQCAASAIAAVPIEIQLPRC